MLTVQRVPRVPKPAKAGSMADTEREESKTLEEPQADPGNHSLHPPGEVNSKPVDRFKSPGPTSLPPLPPDSASTEIGRAHV